MKQVGRAPEPRVFIDKPFDEDEEGLIAICSDFNAECEEVFVEAIRGDVENTGNRRLVKRFMVPCERTIPEPSRFSLLYRGEGRMIDHLPVSRTLLAD